MIAPLRRGLLALTLVALALAGLQPHVALGWGGSLHHVVNRSATTYLPPEFMGFAIRWADSLEMLSTAADQRKGHDPSEGMKHYIDIDDYPEFQLGTLPHDYDTMVARYGRPRVEANGILPWAIQWSEDSLVSDFRRHDWRRVVVVAADIGHYVADSYQPLHLTVNYDGQLTGQRGIHSRYESAMADEHVAELTPGAGGAATRYYEPIEAVFRWIDGVYGGVNLILVADEEATAAAGGAIGSSTYYDVLWQRTGAETQAWVRDASLAVAGMWWSAWVEAGRPQLPGDTTTAPPRTARFELTAIRRNPFNTSTVVTFALPWAGPARLRILDARGRQVRVLLDGPANAGEQGRPWNGLDDSGERVASGVYRVRLEQGGRVAEARAILVR